MPAAAYTGASSWAAATAVQVCLGPPVGSPNDTPIVSKPPEDQADPSLTTPQTRWISTLSQPKGLPSTNLAPVKSHAVSMSATDVSAPSAVPRRISFGGAVAVSAGQSTPAQARQWPVLPSPSNAWHSGQRDSTKLQQQSDSPQSVYSHSKRKAPLHWPESAHQTAGTADPHLDEAVEPDRAAKRTRYSLRKLHELSDRSDAAPSPAHRELRAMTSVRSSRKSSRGPDRAEALEGMQEDYRGTLAEDQEKLVLVTSVQQLQHELKVSLTDFASV